MRKKEHDLKVLDHFNAVLEEFRREKAERWERIDDAVQAKNRPGTPTEDWIIPPDENEAEQILMQDEQYRKLKGEIKSLKKHVEEVGVFLGDKSWHVLRWLNFENPLIGNAALEDCIMYGKRLRRKCLDTNYVVQTLLKFFS